MVLSSVGDKNDANGIRLNRFSSIEPRSPTSPHSPNGHDHHQIYTVQDDDDVFADEKEVPKDNTDGSIVPPPPTPGTAPPLNFNQKTGWSKRKVRVRDVILIVVGVVLFIGLAVGTALAIILVNTTDTSSSSSPTTTVAPSEDIQYNGHLNLSTPWQTTVVELENLFIHDMEIIINASLLYKAFVKSSLLNVSANEKLIFTLDFKRKLLEEVSDAEEITDNSLAQTVQTILREEVVKNAGIIQLPIEADTIVILADNIPATVTTTASTTTSTSTTTSSTTSSSTTTTTTATTTSTTTEVMEQCLPMPMNTCHTLYGTSNFYLPNMFHHTTAKQAEDAFSELSRPNTNTECSRTVLLYLCSMLFPSCDDEPDVPIYPCDTFCEVVKDECGTLSGWPQNCEEFPTENCRAPPETPTTTPTPTTTTTTTTTVSTTTTTAESTIPPQKYRCVELDIPICKAMGLTETVLPSQLFEDCDTIDCIKVYFDMFVQDSLTSGCTDDFTFFCGYLFPGCDPVYDTVYPCLETCQDAVGRCGKNMGWPPECSEFVSSNSSDRPCLPPRPPPVTTTPIPDKCVDQTFDYCASLGFTRTNEKTWFGDTLQESIQEFETWARPTINSDCSDMSRFFYCGLFFPVCEAEKDIGLPCRKYCEEVNANCPNAAFPMDCTVLDEDESICVTPASLMTTTAITSTTPTTTTTSTTTESTTPTSGSTSPPAPMCTGFKSDLCSHFGYNLTSYPSIWYDLDEESANKSYYLYAEVSVSSGCSENILFYVCSMIFPYCEGEGYIGLPCPQYCEEVKANCPSFFPQDCLYVTDPNPDTCLHPPPRIVCPEDEFTCVNLNKCVPKSALCNKMNDCGDWSDERKCECHPEFEVQCAMGMCIPSYHRCDGEAQCPDNSDENACQAGCEKNQHKCNNSEICIQNEWLCDGHFDCPEKDDEEFCSPCGEDKFTCVDKKCIKASERCDGVANCADHSDEMDCIHGGDPYNPNSPFFLKFGDDFIVTCADDFTDAIGQTTCLKTGQQGLKAWHSVDTSFSPPFFQLDANGDNSSAIGRGKFVEECPSGNVVAVECIPKECGHRSPNLPNFIINGQDAQPGFWPWMVSLRKIGKHYCGGAIIHPYFILTAGHCVSQYVDFTYHEVVAGTTSLTEMGPYGQRKAMRQVILHPTFVYLKRDDIALVELSTPLKFNDYVKPICLPTDDDVFTRANECFLSGWGHTKGIGGEVSENLQESKMSLWDTQKCNSSYMWDRKLNQNDMCAGYYNGLIAACDGDSGSPISCLDETNTWKVAGVASYVASNCDVPRKPMVYAAAKPYVDWINNHTVCHFTCDNGICLFDKNMLCNKVDDCGGQDRSDEIRLCDIRTNCSFSDNFICGYTTPKKYLWDSATSGGSIHINRYPLFDHTIGKYPGRFMFGKFPGADIITPRIDLTTPHCVRFHYHMRGTVTLGMAISAHELELGTWGPPLWNVTRTVGPDLWLMGTFDLKPGHYNVLFRAQDSLRFSIDDVWLLEGTCAEMECLDGEFMCMTYGRKNCLPLAVRCNVVQDCDGGEDEKDCAAASYNCDFENGNICRLEQHSNDTLAGEWQMVNASSTPNQLQDHTHQNASGTMLMINTKAMLSHDHAVMSHKVYVDDTNHCLKFYYASTSVATLDVTLLRDGSPERLLRFTNRRTAGWIYTQTTLLAGRPGEELILVYSAIGSDTITSLGQAIMLDDITITRGLCPSFSCGQGEMHCEDEAYCLDNSKVCDRVVDCLRGTDEINCVCDSDEFKCPTASCIPRSETCDLVRDCPDGSDEGTVCDSKRTVSCDFEDKFMCGYTVNTSVSVYHWERVNGRIEREGTGPYSDHTFIGDSGSSLVGFYMLADNQLSGQSTSLTSTSFMSNGNGLVFFYHAYHFAHLFRDTGRISVTVTNMNTGVQNELWYEKPDGNNQWKTHCVDLPAGNITVSFVVQKGANTANMAVDDIMHLDTSCNMFLTDSRMASAGTNENTDNAQTGCKDTEKACRNNLCLPASQFCDKIKDCPDGSDEFNCPVDQN